MGNNGCGCGGGGKKAAKEPAKDEQRASKNSGQARSTDSGQANTVMVPNDAWSNVPLGGPPPTALGVSGANRQRHALSNAKGPTRQPSKTSGPVFLGNMGIPGIR